MLIVTAAKLKEGDVFTPDEGLTWVTVKLVRLSGLRPAIHVVGMVDSESRIYVKTFKVDQEVVVRI